jgi:hypothetical protein
MEENTTPPNPFKVYESDATAPEGLKKAITSEVDIIRNAGEMLDLYVGNLFGSLGQMFPQEDKTKF